MCYENWYDTVGYIKEDEIRDWLTRMPDGVYVGEIEFNTDEWIQIQLESMYECNYGEYMDRCYDEYKDDSYE